MHKPVQLGTEMWLSDQLSDDFGPFLSLSLGLGSPTDGAREWASVAGCLFVLHPAVLQAGSGCVSCPGWFGFSMRLGKDLVFFSFCCFSALLSELLSIF